MELKTSKAAGLYIHIPFCFSKCSYCSFYSVPVPQAVVLIDSFIDAILREMPRYRNFDNFDTLYIGGGTPSLLSFPQIERILRGIDENFRMLSDSERTIEVNPADLDEASLRSLRQAGFNRISIGMQSLDDRVLSFLGRRHTATQAIASFEAARRAGFENIGLDFIYGIPGELQDASLTGLGEILNLQPEHMSCYQLSFESGTPLEAMFRRGDISKPGEGQSYEFFMGVAEILSQAGYNHYEVSNFAIREDKQSRHNNKYWDHSPYLGLGPAAHSFCGNHRWWNRSSFRDYICLLESGMSVVEKEECLDANDLRLERLCLGLRTKKGISVEEYTGNTAGGLTENKKNLLNTFIQEDLIYLEGGFLKPTRRGMAVADALALELS